MEDSFRSCDAVSIDVVMSVIPNCLLSSYIKESYLLQLMAA